MKLRNEPYKDLLRYTNKRICNFNSTVASTRRKINPVTSEEIGYWYSHPSQGMIFNNI